MAPADQLNQGAADGDFRGPYGYGRPAHMQDPNAEYGFQPEVMPLLPSRSEDTVSSSVEEKPLTARQPDPDLLVIWPT